MNLTASRKALVTLTYVIHEHTENGWKQVLRTTNKDEIDVLDWWYFNHIMENSLDYVKVGDRMYDIVYNTDFR